MMYYVGMRGMEPNEGETGMCNFFSGIIGHKHRKVYFDVDLDSHTDIMEKFKLADDELEPVFVKFEFTPVNGVFDHSRENWRYSIDGVQSQDSIPDWYDASRAEEQAWAALQEVFAARILIGAKDCEIKSGRWYVKDSTIEVVMGGTIEAVVGGTIKVVRGGTIEAVSGGTIEAVVGGTIEGVWGGTIKAVSGGTIEVVMGGTIEVVMGGTIKVVRGGTIKAVSGGTIVKQRGGMVVRGKKITVCDKSYTIEYV